MSEKTTKTQPTPDAAPRNGQSPAAPTLDRAVIEARIHALEVEAALADGAAQAQARTAESLAGAARENQAVAARRRVEADALRSLLASYGGDQPGNAE
jgi:hypothetical protein